MSGSVQPEDLLPVVTAAFSALWRAVRAVALYHPDHPQVRPFAAICASKVQECCGWKEPLVVDVSAGSIRLAGLDLSGPSGARLSLLARLHADGLRQLHFRATFDVPAALTLAATLAPYQSADQAPIDSVTDRLHWKPMPGLHFVVHGRSAVAADAGGRAERDWEERLRAPRAMPGTAHLPDRARMTAVWDGQRGRIPWPQPAQPGGMKALAAEVEEADRSGVTSQRVGDILADLLDAYPHEPELRRVWGRLTAGVDQRLERGAPAEASALLQPLARWAEGATADPTSTAARARVEQFLTLLLHPARLTLLLQGVQRQTMPADGVAAWFAALPRETAAQALAFAAAIPAGPYRTAVLDVVGVATAEAPALLVAAVREQAIGPAFLAFELGERSPEPASRERLGMAAASRAEPALAVRGARLLLALSGPLSGPTMIGLLGSPHGELVVLAATYVARRRPPEARAPLESMIGAAGFTQRPRVEQVALCVAFGACAGSVAASVARRRLGPNPELVDVERSAPWILCLAAAGGPEGRNALPALLAPRLGLGVWVAEVRALLGEGPT